jgi:hypothetical protein
MLNVDSPLFGLLDVVTCCRIAYSDMAAAAAIASPGMTVMPNCCSVSNRAAATKHRDANAVYADALVKRERMLRQVAKADAYHAGVAQRFVTIDRLHHGNGQVATEIWQDPLLFPPGRAVLMRRPRRHEDDRTWHFSRRLLRPPVCHILFHWTGSRHAHTGIRFWQDDNLPHTIKTGSRVNTVPELQVTRIASHDDESA